MESKMINRRFLALLLAATTALSAAGCSSSDSSAASDPGSAEAASSSESAADSVTETESDSEADAIDNTPLNVPEIEMPDTTALKADYEASAAEREELFKKLASANDNPIVNITIAEGDKIDSKDEYTAAVIDVFNCDDQYRLSAAGGVKVRGNSTADQGDIKPYRIKFEEKHNMLGLHDGEEYRSWVLLRSYWNFVPDYMAFSLAKEIFQGEYYSSDFTYVNVYVNGKFRDVYLLCEQNQAQRTDLNTPKADDNSPETGYFVEMDNYPGEDHPFFTLDYSSEQVEDFKGQKRLPASAEYSVKSDINTQGQLDHIEKYFKGVWEIVYQGIEKNTPMMFDENYNVVSAEGTYSTVQEAVEAVLDTKSAANMLILEELVHNYDVGEGSFYFAVDFSPESSYKKLTMLAPWDFNWAYEGNGSRGWYASAWQPEVGSQDRSNPWFVMLMKADWFVETVKERWTSFGGAEKLTEVTAAVSKRAEEMKHDIGEESWRADSGQDIVKFVNQRVKFLEKEWFGE